MIEWLALAPWLIGTAALLSALLVYRRQGQTVAVTAEDSETKRFEAITRAQDQLRQGLQARIDELAAENSVQRQQLNALQLEVPALREEHAECLREQSRLRRRVEELEWIVESMRRPHA